MAFEFYNPYSYFTEFPDWLRDIEDPYYDFTTQTSGPDVLAGLQNGSYGPINDAYGMSADDLNTLITQYLDGGGNIQDSFSYANPYSGRTATMPGFNSNPAPIIDYSNYLGSTNMNPAPYTGASVPFEDVYTQNAQAAYTANPSNPMGYNGSTFGNYGTSNPSAPNMPNLYSGAIGPTGAFQQPSTSPQSPMSSGGTFQPSSLSFNNQVFQTSSSYFPSSLDSGDLSSELTKQSLENRKQSFNQTMPSIV